MRVGLPDKPTQKKARAKRQVAAAPWYGVGEFLWATPIGTGRVRAVAIPLYDHVPRAIHVPTTPVEEKAEKTGKTWHMMRHQK
jgi:hypothetical protein